MNFLENKIKFFVLNILMIAFTTNCLGQMRSPKELWRLFGQQPEKKYTYNPPIKKLKEENGKKWLLIPEANDSVEVQIDNGQKLSIIDESTTEGRKNLKSIKYINDNKELPQGLYHWKSTNKVAEEPTEDAYMPMENEWKKNDKKFKEQNNKHPWENLKSDLFKKFREYFYEVMYNKKSSENLTEADFTKKDSSQKRNIISSTIGGKPGSYKEYSIKDLRSKTEKQSPLQNKKTGFTLDDRSIQELLTELPDQTAIQSASTFFGLEEALASKDKLLLINMQKNAHQGETVSVCFLYGSIYRKYLHDKEINYLKDVIETEKDKTIETLDYYNLSEEKVDKIKIGYQKDTTLAYEKSKESGRSQKGYPFLERTNDSRKMDQIISFAINLNQGKIKENYTKPYSYDRDNIEKTACQVLDATYELAFRSAFRNKRKILVLTLVGTGHLFPHPKPTEKEPKQSHTPHQWVIDAIKKMQPFAVEKNMNIILVIPKEARKDLDKKTLSAYKKLEEDFKQAFRNKKEGGKKAAVKPQLPYEKEPSEEELFKQFEQKEEATAKQLETKKILQQKDLPKPKPAEHRQAPPAQQKPFAAIPEKPKPAPEKPKPLPPVKPPQKSPFPAAKQFIKAPAKPAPEPQQTQSWYKGLPEQLQIPFKMLGRLFAKQQEQKIAESKPIEIKAPTEEQPEITEEKEPLIKEEAAAKGEEKPTAKEEKADIPVEAAPVGKKAELEPEALEGKEEDIKKEEAKLPAELPAAPAPSKEQPLVIQAEEPAESPLENKAPSEKKLSEEEKAIGPTEMLKKNIEKLKTKNLELKKQLGQPEEKPLDAGKIAAEAEEEPEEEAPTDPTKKDLLQGMNINALKKLEKKIHEKETEIHKAIVAALTAGKKDEQNSLIDKQLKIIEQIKKIESAIEKAEIDREIDDAEL